MSTFEDPSFKEMSELFEEFLNRVDEKIGKDQKLLEANKKNNELELKLEKEWKLNIELNSQLDGLTKRLEEVSRARTALKERLSICDSDRNRLELAKDMYQIGRDLTGIRFNFSAPPEVIEGYVKNETRKLLEPFEMDAGAGADALWGRVRSAAGPGWPTASARTDENLPPLEYPTKAMNALLIE